MEIQQTGTDLQFLQKYASGCKIAVELGTFQGGSAQTIAPLVEKLYTVDVFESTETIRDDLMKDYYGNMKVDKEDCLYEKVKERLSQFNNVVVLKSLTYEAVSLVPEQVDYLLIDADHTYFGVAYDFFSWYKKVNIGGKILFHDSVHRGWGGVTDFVSSLITHSKCHIELVEDSDNPDCSISAFVKRM